MLQHPEFLDFLVIQDANIIHIAAHGSKDGIYLHHPSGMDEEGKLSMSDVQGLSL